MLRNYSDDRLLAEAAARHRVEQLLAARALVVPRERHLTHERGARGLEPVVTVEHPGEAAHAALAADAADLDRLAADRHGA